MRASSTGLMLLALVPLLGPIPAGATDDAAVVQNPAPSPSPQPFHLQPQPRPRQPLFPVPPPARSPAAVARCGTMRIIPADPSIDPKFVRPIPDTGTKYAARQVPAWPLPACK